MNYFKGTSYMDELREMAKKTATNGVRYDELYNKKRIVDKYFYYDKIIFNEPATIVLWKDKTKTVVKCGENDTFDPEKGLALCFMKRALGNKSGPFNKVLKKETGEKER